MSAESPCLLRRLDQNLEKPLLVAGMLLMIFIISYQTIYRYSITSFISALENPGIFMSLLGQLTDLSFLREHASSLVGGAVWTEESARYIFIWISYLAIPLAIRQRTNIRVDILYDRVGERLQAASWIVVDLCLLLFSLFMLREGASYVQMQIQMPQMTAALRIPYFIPYLILPVGFGLMALRCCQNLAAQVRQCGPRDSLCAAALTVVLFLPPLFMEDGNAIALLFGYFIILLAIGVPIAFSLGLAGLMTVVGADTLPADYLASVAFTSIDSFPIMAIPFFIAAGIFMGAGGLSQRLLRLADALVGGLPGGMALAAIATCMFRFRPGHGGGRRHANHPGHGGARL